MMDNPMTSRVFPPIAYTHGTQKRWSREVKATAGPSKEIHFHPKLRKRKRNYLGGTTGLWPREPIQMNKDTMREQSKESRKRCENTTDVAREGRRCSSGASAESSAGSRGL